MPTPPRCAQSGLTLIELALALALIAVLSAVATPSFGRLRSEAGLRREAHELLGALHAARSAAISRGLPVIVCQTAGGVACLDTASAAAGWAIFVDQPGGIRGEFDTGDELLRVARLPGGFRLLGSRRVLTYWPVARAGTTATLRLCHASGAALAVIVSQTGRPRISRTGPGGSPLDCGA